MGCNISLHLPPGSMVVDGEDGIQTVSAPVGRRGSGGGGGARTPVHTLQPLPKDSKDLGKKGSAAGLQSSQEITPQESAGTQGGAGVSAAAQAPGSAPAVNFSTEKTLTEKQNRTVKEDYQDSLQDQLTRLQRSGTEVFFRVSTLLDLADVKHANVLNVVHKLLWRAADKPTDESLPFDERNLKTWTLNHIRLLKMEECNELIDQLETVHRDGAGKNLLPLYRQIPNKSPIAIESLKGNALNLEPVMGEFLFPVDKQDVTLNAGKLFEFALDVIVFESETAGRYPNKKEALQELLKLMLAKHIAELKHGREVTGGGVEAEEEEIAFLTLWSSPVNAVTLEPVARANAKIPLDASFYSFCYPYEFVTTDKYGNKFGEPVTAAQLEKLGINSNDPFVCWLLYGGFAYFNYTYEILAINAIIYEREQNEIGFSLNLGIPTPMKAGSVRELYERDRFRETTHAYITGQGITEFAWITPSEMVEKTIFTRNGGFAFKFGNGETANERWLFFPVVPPKTVLDFKPTEWESPVHIPEYIAYYRKQSQKINKAIVKQDAEDEGKYAPDVGSMAYGDGQISALGLLHLLGLTTKDVTSFEGTDEGVSQIRHEFEALAKSRCGGDEAAMNKQEDWVNFMYVLEGKTPDGEFSVKGNDGIDTVRDKGRDRSHLSLDHFCDHHEARNAKLMRGEVLALRLYTSSSFRSINIPLRKITQEYTRLKKEEKAKVEGSSLEQRRIEAPLPATTYFISTALKKLRVQNMANRKFRSTELWRGMRNLTSSQDFMMQGGAEGACMSTTPDLRVVANYSKSESPLLLKIKIESPMDHGADISWLSIFPEEKEALYPPLTFLKPLRVQPIRGLEGRGEVITVKPSFPS